MNPALALTPITLAQTINSPGVQLPHQPDSWKRHEKGTEDGTGKFLSCLLRAEKRWDSCLKAERRCDGRVRAVDWSTRAGDGLLGRHHTHKQHDFTKRGRQQRFNRLSPCLFF